jgi:hypothetical protein
MHYDGLLSPQNCQAHKKNLVSARTISTVPTTITNLHSPDIQVNFRLSPEIWYGTLICYYLSSKHNYSDCGHVWLPFMFVLGIRKLNVRRYPLVSNMSYDL